MPKAYFNKIVKLYPEEPLYAGPIQISEDGLMTYADEIKAEMLEYVTELLLQWFPQSSFYDHDR